MRENDILYCRIMKKQRRKRFFEKKGKEEIMIECRMQ